MDDSRERQLAQILSEGLDLCIRARKMEQMDRDRAEMYMRDPDMTRSLTIPLWAEEQYQTDLASWETRARKALAPYVALVTTPSKL